MASLEGCGAWGSQPVPWPGAWDAQPGERRNVITAKSQLVCIAGRCPPAPPRFLQQSVSVARELKGRKDPTLPTSRTDSANIQSIQTHLDGTDLPEATPLRSPSSDLCHSLSLGSLLPLLSLRVETLLSAPLLSGNDLNFLSWRRGLGRTLVLSNICGETTRGQLGEQGQAWPLAESLFITSFTCSVKALQFQPKRSREK